MPIATVRVLYRCARCQLARSACVFPRDAFIARRISTSPPSLEPTIDEVEKHGKKAADAQASDGQQDEEKGAFSRRLEQMSEEALETGGTSAQKAVEEVVFDVQLRKELEERIANANFRNEHPSALAQADLPESAGRATRELAGARPWTGTETLEDTAQRMLNDAYKPLKAPAVKGSAIRSPTKVDTGRPIKGTSSGHRMVNARDRSSYYSFMKDANMGDAEREQLRKEMKARFDPSARSLPATIQGLASLANERIEDAIARGQFKNLPRGSKIERDYNASSPFIDTTEYLLNKIIQKQDIVPPWIEKQQELLGTANKFRARLRNDWKRHAARSISSRGGSLESQIRTAEEYAAAEVVINPAPKKEEKINVVDAEGHLSQITLAGELKVQPTADAVEEKINITETSVEPEATASLADPPSETNVEIPQPEPPEPSITSVQFPFRDPQWLAAEQSYLTHTINHLNSLARSYNLMAPDLAKKPYYSLDRELASMYRDVAPQLPGAIRERATSPKARVGTSTGQAGSGVLAALGAGEKSRVYDESKQKHYGLKEFWRDLFGKGT